MGSRDLEEFVEWDRRRNSWFQNIMKSMQPLHMVALLGFFVFAFYLIQKGEGFNKNYVLLGVGIVVLLVLLRSKKTEEKKPLPENVVKILAYQKLSRKIGTEFPNGTRIFPAFYCKMRFMGEWGESFKPWKWEVGFKIKYPNNLVKVVLVIMDPYEGYITGLVAKPAGYYGEDSTDLKVLLPTQLAVKEEGKPQSGP